MESGDGIWLCRDLWPPGQKKTAARKHLLWQTSRERKEADKGLNHFVSWCEPGCFAPWLNQQIGSDYSWVAGGKNQVTRINLQTWPLMQTAGLSGCSLHRGVLGQAVQLCVYGQYLSRTQQILNAKRFIELPKSVWYSHKRASFPVNHLWLPPSAVVCGLCLAAPRRKYFIKELINFPLVG